LEKRRPRGRAFFWLVDSFMLGFYYVTSFLTLLPASVFYPMVRALAAVLFYARGAARRNLVENIANAMPEIAGDKRELERIGRGTYSSLLFAIPDLIYFKRHPLRFMRGLTVEGLENLEKADQEGTGVLGLLVHHGNAHKHIFMVLLEKPYMLVMSNPETASAVPRYTGKLVSTTFSLAEDSEKLVKLTVDFGDRKRTILVGMKQERENPKEIEGRQALFVVNLEPKKMMGQISEGMLFDIGYADGIRPVLAVPEGPVPNGTRAG